MKRDPARDFGDSGVMMLLLRTGTDRKSLLALRGVGPEFRAVPLAQSDKSPQGLGALRLSRLRHYSSYRIAKRKQPSPAT